MSSPLNKALDRNWIAASAERERLERENADLRSDVARLREALEKLRAAYITARSGQEMTDEEISLAATVNHALAARKDSGTCEHGRKQDEYCQPCGRVNG